MESEGYIHNDIWPEINQRFMVVDETALKDVREYIDYIVREQDQSRLMEDCRYLLRVLEDDYNSILINPKLYIYYSWLNLGSSKLIELFYNHAKSRLSSMLNNGIIIPVNVNYDPGYESKSEMKYTLFIYFVSYYLKKKAITVNNNSWFLNIAMCPSNCLGKAMLVRHRSAGVFPKEPLIQNKEDDLIWYSTGTEWTRVNKEKIYQAYNMERDEILNEMDQHFLNCMNELTPSEILYYNTKWKFA